MCVNILIHIPVKNGKPGGTDSDRFWQIEPGEIENPARAPNQRQPARKEPLGPEIAAEEGEEVRNWGSIQQTKTGNI